MPLCDHSGTPAGFIGFFHFCSSLMPGSASRIRSRMRASVFSRQSSAGVEADRALAFPPAGLGVVFFFVVLADFFALAMFITPDGQVVCEAREYSHRPNQAAMREVHVLKSENKMAMLRRSRKG